ncbi:SDR family NAD(P)-dependent oxidoreductase [Salinicoccus albus]|uniref:SDR family NAD(P)-dependent oxidoreductase n=1 Tax=Salinicoccus albus TaxID=418756 RepID=UPI00037EDB24|nr:SDR family NAD(P)-dependent oxidoreductase [Salinicoccus albus]
MKPISECTVLITGATSGLGRMTAEWFAQNGAKVLLHGRNEEKGYRILEEIKNTTGNQKLAYFNGDFSSLASVAQLAEKIVSNERELDILINNAGIGGGPKSRNEREISRDGFELRWAVNYLAQVLMTRKLAPLLNDGSRIINVASIGQSAIDFDDLNMEETYEGYLAYARSKLALIMFTFDLADELKDRGVNVNALHPSTLMDTNMVDKHFGSAQSTVEQGLDAVIFLAASEDIKDVTGEYFDGRKHSNAASQAYDNAARENLKTITQESLNSFI